ncbi:hypothetical protein GOBAR_DD35753 [Gossypium barbadense]|nr:hypothetical protein GOBAR_DD35753 [Gossypium barbadense]
MVLEAPAHSRHQGANGAQGSGTSDRLGADGARSSRTFEPPGCHAARGTKKYKKPNVGSMKYGMIARQGRKLNKSPTMGSSHPHQQGPRCAMFPEGGCTTKCLTNSLHQVPHLGTPGSSRDSTRRSVGITLQGGTHDLSAAVVAPTTRALGGQRPLLRVSNRAMGSCIASSPDFDLEEFSHNPAHGSFAPLPFQPSAMTNCANQRFLSY